MLPVCHDTLPAPALYASTERVSCFSFLPSLLLGAALLSPGAFLASARAQTPAAAPAATASSQRGTVKAVTGSSLTLSTDAGKDVAVTLSDKVRVLQVAPGSKDLKDATTIQVTDVAVGDKVLVTGKAGDTPDTMTVSRVIVMKSTDIAEKHAAEQADWQKRGSGGLVSAVDAGTGTITVSNGAKKTQVMTSGTTVFRRYAGDSVKFEDAQLGTMAQVQPGDQVRVRGAKSEDGTSIQAEEVVSGSFRNIAGTVASIDGAAGTVTIKDLATKRTVVVKVTANSEVKKLPPEAAARFAARAKAAGAGGDAKPGGAAPASASAGAPSGAGGEGGRRPGGEDGPGSSGGGRSAGMDLSQMLARLPDGKLADLKAGDAVMIVASQTQPGAGSVTAVTMLSGVEPILAATPSGSPAMTLSPWSMGGAPEGGGGGGGGR
ncbi:copper-binding protein [Granulicella sibirica]|uniref:Cell wall surface anchor family protein n=1 Tax=Granulicella sibirica TaxID=2479048 RepID=A0A4Q0T2V5_9BACT|nr:copper-binding protein [Granulicella sibirica]RXH57202.1 cell wall surface anchor family protein [Granulicella sibirica]